MEINEIAEEQKLVPWHTYISLEIFLVLTLHHRSCDQEQGNDSRKQLPPHRSVSAAVP